MRHFAKAFAISQFPRYGGPQLPPTQSPAAGAMLAWGVQRTLVGMASSSRACCSSYYHYYHYWLGLQWGNWMRRRLVWPGRAAESRHCCHCCAAAGAEGKPQ